MIPTLNLTTDQLHVSYRPGEQAVAVEVELPDEVCDRIRHWVRSTRDLRCRAWYALNLYVEEEFDTASLFFIDGQPCMVGEFDRGEWGQGPRMVGIQVIVDPGYHGLDYTQPRTELTLDARLRAAAIIRQLLAIGTGAVGGVN